jgi:hypothetical protein
MNDGRWHLLGDLQTLLDTNTFFSRIVGYEIGTSVIDGGTVVPTKFTVYNCMVSLVQLGAGVTNASGANGPPSFRNAIYWGTGAGCPGTFVGRYIYHSDLNGQVPTYELFTGTVSSAAAWQVWVRR